MSNAVVYAVRAGDYVKIGVTGDLRRRVAQLRSKHKGCLVPDDFDPTASVDLVGWLYGTGEIEKALQDAFAEYHVVSEWFLWNDKIAAWCSRRRQGLPSAWKPGDVVKF
jgi:T5orf172 domain